MTKATVCVNMVEFNLAPIHPCKMREREIGVLQTDSMEPEVFVLRTASKNIKWSHLLFFIVIF